LYFPIAAGTHDVNALRRLATLAETVKDMDETRIAIGEYSLS
jgi:hypothetical protein